MKIRSDFVTNSSSSSFICELCGRMESGWDMGPEEADMYECEYGHVFCMDEAVDLTKERLIVTISENDFLDEDECRFSMERLESMTLTELIDICKENLDYRLPYKFCPICNFVIIPDYMVGQYLKKKTGITEKQVLKQVKIKYPKRKGLYQTEYTDYVCHERKINPQEIKDEIRTKFLDYSDLNDYLKS